MAAQPNHSLAKVSRIIAKTAAVVVGGVFLTQLLSTLVALALNPVLRALVLHQSLVSDAQALERQILAGRLMACYVADPIAGLGVGLFVGWLQRPRPTLVAIVCWVPDILLLIFGTGVLRLPAAEIAGTAAGKLTTILCSALAANVIWRLRHKRMSVSTRRSPVVNRQ